MFRINYHCGSKVFISSFLKGVFVLDIGGVISSNLTLDEDAIGLGVLNLNSLIVVWDVSDPVELDLDIESGVGILSSTAGLLPENQVVI